MKVIVNNFIIFYQLQQYAEKIILGSYFSKNNYFQITIFYKIDKKNFLIKIFPRI